MNMNAGTNTCRDWARLRGALRDLCKKRMSRGGHEIKYEDQRVGR